MQCINNREAMTIPKDAVSDFLTKIAHGEVIGSHDTLFNTTGRILI